LQIDFLLGVLFFILVLLIIFFINKATYYYTIIKTSENEFKYDKYLHKLDFYKNLSPLQQKRLKRDILVMLNTKEFIGFCPIETKIAILAYASLMVINQNDFELYKEIDTIVLKNHTLLKNEKKSVDGITTEYVARVEGFSSSGVVVLSLPKAKKDIKNHSKDNLVIHEFAHQLDLENGLMNGTPILENSLYSEWAKVLSKDFNKLKNRIKRGRFIGKYSFLGRYASTNEAEFFAVCSELYFQKPKELFKHFPDIYKELNKYYKLNTKEWDF
jgi:Mlc titration factor MtfA (ptsG expression regulator)